MKVNIKTSLENCYVSTYENNILTHEKEEISSFRIDTTKPLKVIIEPFENYEIKEIPYFYVNDTYRFIFYKNGSNYELTINFDTVEDGLFHDFVQIKTITLNAKSELSIKEEIIEVDTPKYAHIKLNLTNCACNIADGDFNSHTNILIRVTCENGFEFDNVPVFGDTLETTATGEYVPPNDDIFGRAILHDTQDFNFVKVDNFTYEITVNLLTNITYQLVATAAKTTNVLDKYGLINAYRLNRHELREIAKHRWIEQETEAIKNAYGEGTYIINIKDKYLDSAKFIVSLIKINVPIETTQKEKLFFGPYMLDIDCDIIETDIITLDFGNVEINGLYNNAIDFEHTEIQLYLPYIGFVDLNTVDYMNKTLSLTYQVNILNGDSLVILKANDNITQTISCNIAIKIPYKMEMNEYINTSFEPNNHYLNEINPFLYIKTNKAVNLDENLTYRNTKYYAVLGTLSGYTEATEIQFEVKNDFITKSEIEKIKQLINQGVIL